MSKYKLAFSIDMHDSDGDTYEEGILLHLGNGVILHFNNLKEYDNFIDSMQGMRDEIRENL
ncbi:hypothetical protein CIL05_07355 [Virgibacillus profundi]|uniref:Uncharacterized protein n=1 Tax=Virgibacillus profundi TaxID=2024555 RepID=A0A2A2IF46_9BACI|nr:hypothetical protein [Virgibacillus profundi]PAV30277.1 hypothetical protein CIL05_07355 [Virgibacillus profundi]PXY54449.1 hypothetical protein CIT14_07440 [Virgibacillus profundi]